MSNKKDCKKERLKKHKGRAKAMSEIRENIKTFDLSKRVIK